jgi:hypothetical protein
VSETTRETKGPRERCPFCHEQLAAAESSLDARVECAACRASHHAECFVENEGCAACRERAVRLAGESDPVPLGVLAARVERGTLEPPAPPRFVVTRVVALTSLLAAVLLFLIAGLSVQPAPTKSGFTLQPDFVVAGILFLLISVCVASIGVFLRAIAHRASRIRVDPTLDAVEPARSHIPHLPAYWVGQANPFDAIRERIESETDNESDAPAATPASLPAKCPSCANALEPGEPGSEPIAFCYHCGVPLA